jgi:hypothetical protein
VKIRNLIPKLETGRTAPITFGGRNENWFNKRASNEAHMEPYH